MTIGFIDRAISIKESETPHPPAEYEANHYRQTSPATTAGLK